MQVAELDASRWTDVLQVYDAIYDALGSQYSSYNINALMEGLYWDHAYDMLNGTSHCEELCAEAAVHVKGYKHVDCAQDRCGGAGIDPPASC